jgi:hypothetical protein
MSSECRMVENAITYLGLNNNYIFQGRLGEKKFHESYINEKLLLGNQIDRAILIYI